MKCAVVDTRTGGVTNVIVANPSDLAPDGHVLVGVGADVFCDIGWVWDGAQFVDPAPVVVEPVDAN